MKRFKKIALTVGLSATVIATALLSSILPTNTLTSKAAKVEEADLRFIFTTDIHGQVNSMDYEQGVDYYAGGLARAYDLIKKARSEKADSNSFTFDVGDVMYDYTTEYIFAKDQKVIQPIYKAMALMGYDAITLGNHDFDYGYEYILNQLNGSGLMDVAIVSNVTDSKTGKYPFLENMIITRELETSSGKKVAVKIGIIGETVPVLTAKTEDYTGILKTQDTVASVTEQAAKLKELGADVIVVLAHSGIGPEVPELNFKNVSYALTKIKDVDVVLCGHEHNVYPTKDLTSAYYLLPGVDKNTYLVNGKNLVMASDRGKSIGVVDLTLEVSGDEVEIIDRVSDVRYVSGSNTKEDTQISSLYGTWDEELLQYSKEIIGEVDEGKTLQNFFGLYQDNSAIQLLNDAKRSHAMRFINTEDGSKYKDYPIIAASTYSSFGANSYLEFINIKDKLTESDLVSMQPYNNYLILYTIKGKQLKEWLEWSASAYEMTTGNTSWTDKTMSELMKTTNLKSLIKEEWLADWSNFYIFDGIDYVINPTPQPRYDISGNKINNSNRVSDITYNGKAIADDTEFILAADKITKPAQANKGVENQAVFKKFNRGLVILSDYIKILSKMGSILPTPDNNWHLQLGVNYQFLVKGPANAKIFAEQSDWYDKLLKTENNYSYYNAIYPDVKGDTAAPNLVVVPINTAATGAGYEVAVNATDKSGIKSIKYKNGDYDLGSTDWNYVNTLTSNTFSVKENGIYSVYAEDNIGNKIVKKINIDNISDRVIGKPKVITYTNRKTKIQGTAEAGITIVVETSNGNYETKVNNEGHFSCALPAQASGTVIKVYAKDLATGRISETVNVKIKRTGPNQPSLLKVYNSSEAITGDTNDDDAQVIAIIGDNVYVSSKNGKEFYEKAIEIYDSKKKIIETDLQIQSDGKYSLAITPHPVGTYIMVYSIDHLYRVSRVKTTTIVEGAPDVPVVYQISNIEDSISGNVTSLKSNTIFDVYAVINGTTYQAKSDKNGEFTISILEQLQAGQSISVYAMDTVNGVKRKSATTTVKVADIEEFTDSEYPTLSLDDLTNKDAQVFGTYYNPNEIVYIAICNKDGDKIDSDIYEVTSDAYGDFTYDLSKSLPTGTKIYAMVRFSDGEILDAIMTEVLPTEPIKPYLVKDITNSTKKVYAVTDEECKVVVQIGTKEYSSSKYSYDKKLDAYVYTVEIGRTDSKTKIKVYAVNSEGESEILSSKIVKAAPDSPKVNDVFTDSTTIKGHIELFKWVEPVVDAEIGDDETQDSAVEDEKSADAEASKSKASLVDQTNTKVYAMIGKKTYKAVIDEDGNFTIKIKKQKKGTAITVWGTNDGGRGPLTKVTVQTK